MLNKNLMLGALATVVVLLSLSFVFMTYQGQELTDGYSLRFDPGTGQISGLAFGIPENNFENATAENATPENHTEPVPVFEESTSTTEPEPITTINSDFSTQEYYTQANKPISGYVYQSDNTTAENATVWIWANVQINPSQCSTYTTFCGILGGIYCIYAQTYCYGCNCSALTANGGRTFSNGQFSGDLGNLKYVQNCTLPGGNKSVGDWCRDDWVGASNDTVWAIADGSTVTPNPQGNGTSSHDLVTSGGGTQWLGNFTLGPAADSFAPNITLISPANGTNETLNRTVIFSYNASDDTGIKNCSLYINGNLNQTNTNVTNKANSTFNATFANGAYNWSIACYDTFNKYNTSETWFFFVSLPNLPPYFLTATTDGSSASTPTNVGNNVTFTTNATDPEGQNYKLVICNSSTINQNSTCADALICQSSFVAPQTLATCQHNTSGETQSTYVWYSFVCDDQNCSAYNNTNSPYSVNHYPTYTTISDQNWSEDTQFVLNLSAYFTDTDGDDLNFTATGVQNITVNINNATNTATFTPQANFTGLRNITFTAHDPFGLSNTSNIFTLNITNVNDAPYFFPALQNQTVQEGQTLIYDINASDVDPVTVFSFFDNVTQFEINLTTGLITWTPGNDDVGTLSVTVTVCDDSGALTNCTSSVFSITITAYNDPPVFNTSNPIANISWPEDTNYTINLTPHFYDIDSADLNYSYTAVNNLTVQINQNTGVATLIPAANFNGLIYIRFNATDGNSWSNYSNNLTLNVTPVNDAPYFIQNLTTINLPEDGYNDTVNLSNYVADIDNTKEEINWSVTPTQNVTVTINNLTKTVNVTTLVPNWFGNETVIFTACDLESCVNMSVTIVVVSSINDAPVFNVSYPIDNVTWSEDTIYTINLTPHFYDTDGDSLTYYYTSVQNITVQINQTTGIATLTPQGNFTGIGYIRFNATDGSLWSSYSNNLTLNITPVNDAPTLTSLLISPNTGKNNTFINVTSVGASDLEGDNLVLQCGDSSGNYNLCTSAPGQPPLSCYFNSTWTDDNTHTIYCIVNDTLNLSTERTVNFLADNTPPNASNVLNVEGDTVPKYWDTDDDNNTIIQLSLNETNMACRWDSADLTYSQMNVSHTCTVVGTIASCNVYSSLTGQTNGTTSYISCQDQYGNEQNTSDNTDVYFGMDWTIPSVSDDNDGQIHVPGYNVTLTAYDQPEGTIIYVYYCNDTTGSCAPATQWIATNGSQTTLTFSQRGTWYLRYNATDDAGNINTTKQTIIFINTLPQISQTYQNLTQHAFTVNATVSDIVGSSQGPSYNCQLYYRKAPAAFSNKTMVLISGTATNGTYAANLSTADGYAVFDILETYVNCSDGLEWNVSTTQSNSLTNYKPTAPTVDVVPNSPSIYDDLICNITVNSTDADNDALTYLYAWFKNSVDQNINVSILGAGNTSKGDVWNCTVIPFDGYENGTAASDQVTVGNTAPVFNTSYPIANLSWPEDTVYTINLTLHFYDPDNDSLTYYYTSVQNLTVQINQTTGIATLIPQGNFTGVRYIQFNATDGSLWSSYSNNVTLNITNVNDAPYFYPALQNQTVQEGQTLLYDINASDVDPVTVFSFFDNATQFNIDPTTGLINWTPGNDDAGTLSVNVTVCDDSGEVTNCTSSIFSITITAYNDPPVFNISNPIANLSWPEDTNYTINLTPHFYDIDSADLNYSYTAVSNITITIDQDTGIATITPQGNFTGVRYVQFRATDGNSWSNYSNNITLNITPVNDAPYFIQNLTTINLPEDGYNDTVNLSNYVADVDNTKEEINWSVTPTQNVTVTMDNITKIVNVTTLIPNWFGNETVIFTACDLEICVNMSVTIVVVSGVNDPPVVNLTILQNYIIPEDSYNDTLNLSNYVSDVEDANELINWNCLSNNINVSALADNTTKLLNITTLNNFTGTANITCTAYDTNGGSGSGTFTLNVTNVNDAPYFFPPLTNLTAYENQTFIFDVNATDIDPTGDTFNFTSNSTLFVIDPFTGLINFTPNSSDIGSYDINFTVCDNSGACQSQVITLTIVNMINNIIFNVYDRLTQTFLDNVTVIGGTTCAAGCTFNGTLTIVEPTGLANYTFSKPGFTSNFTQLNITNDLELNISLDDNQNPIITAVNITPRLSATNDSYYIDILVNVTDNLNVANVTFTYNLSYDYDEANTVFLTRIDNQTFTGTLGPYNATKILMNSSVFANDTYSNFATKLNDNIWFMFAKGSVTCAANNTMTLELFPGWNLFSVFPLTNASLRKHLAPLSNGNWGCGHDGIPPFDCNASDGDFVGNWTMIWTQNRSWEYFRPDVYYTLIDNQTLQDLNFDQGYWIYMTAAQNLTIIND